MQAVTNAMEQQAQHLAEDERLRQLRESTRAVQVHRLRQSAGRHTGEVARQLLNSERGQQAQDTAKQVSKNLLAAYEQHRGTRG
ncbi:hypothetical protein OG203_45660 [Nocardia sp. NBC_01499]|uniref:hypothetical protein n=1 Tax=Nocardia sp. NBC_01499 TaxID=2903597 RepID=UPI00386B804D